MPQPIDPSSLPDPMPLGTSKSMPPPPPVLSGPAGAAGRGESRAWRVGSLPGPAGRPSRRRSVQPPPLSGSSAGRRHGRPAGPSAGWPSSPTRRRPGRSRGGPPKRRCVGSACGSSPSGSPTRPSWHGRTTWSRGAGRRATPRRRRLSSPRDALAFQAAAASLDRSSVPPGTDREYGRALSARAAESRLATLAASARRAVFPPARADRMARRRGLPGPRDGRCRRPSYRRTNLRGSPVEARGGVLEKKRLVAGSLSRILSRSARAGLPPGLASDDHFSGPPVTRCLERPTRKSITGRADPYAVVRTGQGGEHRLPGRTRSHLAMLRCSPIWSCSWWGLPSQVGHPTCW